MDIPLPPGYNPNDLIDASKFAERDQSNTEKLTDVLRHFQMNATECV